MENLHEIVPERGVTVYPTAKGCTALTSDGGLVVGRNEAIYFYSTTEKKSARAFDGDRKLIKCFRNYLITVDAANANQKYNTVTVYDDSNKFIAYSGTFENVAFVLTEWNMVLIVCHGGTVPSPFHTFKSSSLRLAYPFIRVFISDHNILLS